ncbi:MAG: hypothetical protein GY716_06870 [bacterium]|nr:hypothetical protein [bacterium]
MRRDHHRADRELLASLRTDPDRSDVSCPLAELDGLESLPACGGLHQSPAALCATAMMSAAERALVDGSSAQGTVEGGREFALPICGVRLVVPDDAALHWVVDAGGELQLSDGGRLLATISRSSPGEPWGVVAGDEAQRLRRTPVGGLTIEPGLVSYDARLPTSASILDRPLTDKEFHAIEVAVGLLRSAAPDLLREMTDEGVRLVPLTPKPGVIRQSCSFRTAPGLVFLNPGDPLEILDLLCHEYHHLKLFRFQEHHELLAEPDVPVAAPWRADTRTAEGLLHGTYVFVMCAWLLDRVYALFPPSWRGRRRLVVFRVCVESALAELRRARAGPIGLGRSLVERIDESNTAALAALNDRLPETVEWARRTVDDHMARSGTERSTDPWFLGT